MSVGGPLDGPIELARLVPPGELDELLDAVRRALGADLAIYDRVGRLLAGSCGRSAERRKVDHDGERLGEVAASGANADTALELVTSSLGLLVHHANARDLAATTHEEAMRITFAELTEHNQRLERAVARLEELDRLKSNFLATMSHEFRTPLTSVIGYAEMMSEGLAGPITNEQRDYLVTILSKADQLLGMITSVLDVASLESGPLIIDRTTLSLAEIVATEVATYMPQAGKRGIAIQLDARGETTILGDKKKIRQIVSSLVSNAVKFTPDRGQVTIGLHPGRLSPHDPDDGRAIQLVVSDSGIGISRDQVSKIFEPFFQVDSSSTRAFGGTGLGLTLAKAYVEAHGGRIWVDTTVGQGSTFTASFPARNVDGTAPPFGGAAGRGQAPVVDGTAPPFGGAAGRGQAPDVDGTAPPFGGAAGRGQAPVVDGTAPPFGGAAGRGQAPDVDGDPDHGRRDPRLDGGA